MYDVLVIGGGPGGYAAAIRAAQLGGKVALCEGGEMGGTCVHRGCIPSKVWSRAAYLKSQIQQSDVFGLNATLGDTNYNAIVERKNGVGADIKMGMEALLGNNGVEVILGRAVLKSATQAEVDGKIIDAKAIILATGSSIAIPDIPGLADCAMTSDQALNLTEMPASLLVWGGGPVEVEIAGWLNTFGVDVTLACEGPRILTCEDSDTSQRLAGALKEQGVKIVTRAQLTEVKKAANGCAAVLGGKQEQTIEAAAVVIASRTPNTAGLGLESMGVELSSTSGILVNQYLESNVKGIFAIGDCTGGRLLSHRASGMAVFAAENAMGQKNIFDERLICRGLWTMPQVGSVGLTEEEAEDMDYDVETGDFPYPINGLAMLRGEVTGNVKVVMDAKYGEILGVHIVGSNATELIGEAALAMQMECTAEELARGVRLHPTFSETMVDAARDAMGWALYLPKR